MSFPNVIDEAIREYEEYKKEERDMSKKIIFSAITSRLWNLREAYFKDWKESADNKR